MKLTKVRITEFRSIQDSTEFRVGDVTCLVGKNESGKTALLKALYRLNPIIEAEGRFDATDDYPRQSLIDYEDDVATNRRQPATVVKATYTFESDDVKAVEDVFGTGCLIDGEPSITLEKGYSNDIAFTLKVSDETTLRHLVEVAGLPQPLAEQITGISVEAMIKILEEAEQTTPVQELTPMLQEIRKHGVAFSVYSRVIHNRIPKFLYFDEYYQMKGQDNLDALKHRVDTNALKGPDHPLVGLIDLAGLKIDQIATTRRTEVLIARLEAAGNQLTQKVLTYWSQNKHIAMKLDVREAKPEDGPGMNSGTNILGRVMDTRHGASTPFGTRSRGFVWFFSFLAWYSKLQRGNENLILLLDEPGLFLHAKAQWDLLRYFEEELKPHHQLIYTTHSPFMVDHRHFDRVRIVQDLSMETDSDGLSEEWQGTKVLTDVLEATSDSLFPLQGALGYEIHQSLFIGPNCLVVEGVSDLLYIQTMSAFLQENGQCGLNADWTITPVGGASNVSTFVALIGARTELNVAVLIDFQKKDKQRIENIYKSKLLKKEKVITYACFVAGNEADIEDMFKPEFYLKLVNNEFKVSISMDDLPKSPHRILRRLEAYLKKNPLPGNTLFNHYRPARYLNENVDSLKAEWNSETLDRFQRAFDVLNQLL